MNLHPTIRRHAGSARPHARGHGRATDRPSGEQSVGADSGSLELTARLKPLIAKGEVQGTMAINLPGTTLISAPAVALRGGAVRARTALAYDIRQLL